MEELASLSATNTSQSAGGFFGKLLTATFYTGYGPGRTAPMCLSATSGPWAGQCDEARLPRWDPSVPCIQHVPKGEVSGLG